MEKVLAMISSIFLILSLFFVLSCKKTEKTVERSQSVKKVVTSENVGEQLFNKQCLLCHREGSKFKNIGDPSDIVKAMRNPKGSMPQFKEENISEQEADEIAKFIFLSIIAHK
jgi:mono/diheme cytochrome c family protein